MTIQKTTLCLLIREQPNPEILLGYKKIGFGQGKYTGFGGKLEPGETPLTAAIRELAEETSVQCSRNQLTPVAVLVFNFPHQPTWSQEVHVFTGAPGDAHPVEGDEMRPAWFSLDKLPYAQMWSDAAYWLPPILAGRRFRAWFSFQADNASVAWVRFSPWSRLRLMAENGNQLRFVDQ